MKTTLKLTAAIGLLYLLFYLLFGETHLPIWFLAPTESIIAVASAFLLAGAVVERI